MSYNPTHSDIQTTLDGTKLIENWDFAKADTKYFTHGLHDYPARMIPQIAKRLIEKYSSVKSTILDPFCGSGTTLVEAMLSQRNAIGNDVNPLALLLSKVKSTPINFLKSQFDLPTFLNKLENDHKKVKQQKKLKDPSIDLPNLFHWFKPEAVFDLEFLYQKIKKTTDDDVKDFLNVVLSNTIFKSSNIDHHSSRFIRVLHEPELKKFKPNVLKNFRKKLIEATNSMNAFFNAVDSQSRKYPKITLNKGDARKLSFPNESVDTIITSPPYGEEKNTLGYVRWAKLSIAWLRLNGNESKITEKQSLGSQYSKDLRRDLDLLPSQTAKNLLEPLMESEAKRVADALPFFLDYLDSLKEMYRILKTNSFCCIVIGDRSIRKIPLDMEKVTLELADNVGFNHEMSFFRKLPMKLIPWITPTGKTISSESIIILKKG